MAKQTVLDKVPRLIGEVDSPSVEILPNVKYPYAIQLIMDEADYEDEKTHIRVEVHLSDDGIKWKLWGFFTYDGGKFDRRGDPPSIVPGKPEQFKGKRVMVRVNSATAVPYGIDFEDDIDYMLIARL